MTIQLKNLIFGYTSDNILINDLSLDLKEKDIVTIYGPSGTGKTTLLNIIGGLLKPNKGSVVVNKKDIFKSTFSYLCSYRSENIGFAFQNFNLLDGFSVKENLNLPFIIGGVKDKDQDWFDYLVDTLQIRYLLEKKIENISGGEKERVSLIKAMVHKPNILLLDEPGSYLNLELRKILFGLIFDYIKDNDKIGIFTSHNEDVRKLLKLKKSVKHQNLDIYRG